MNRSLFVAIIMVVITIFVAVVAFIPKSEPTHAYYLQIDDIDDSISIVTINDELGEVVVMIDNDLGRHGDTKDVKWIRYTLETQIGFSSILEASEKYYNMVNKTNDEY